MRSTDWKITKRDGRVEGFDKGKIRRVVMRCLTEGIGRESEESEPVAERVSSMAVNLLAGTGDKEFDIERVQQAVISQLWADGHYEAAEHYTIYREERRKGRSLGANLFGRRKAFKPFDYPEAVKFKEAIQQSPWTFKKFDPISDIQDYRAGMTPSERSVCAKTMLAISQIEVDVKRFWAKLGDRMPRAEFEQVGIVFAESEIRHADAYSRALDVLGLNSLFATVTDVPCISQRISYLKRAMAQGIGGNEQGFAKVLAVFSLLIENVSLFSQFVVMRSMYQHRGLMKNMDNIIQATQKEELVHALFGAWLCNLIKSERPEWFGDKFEKELRETCLEAYEAEGRILDWIFADGNISSVSRPSLDAFLRDRINQGVQMIGLDPIFDKVGPGLDELEWFQRELTVPVQVDFFWKHATNYTSNDREVSADSMWD